MPSQVERKLAAILSADVVGYSRLMAKDEAATITTLTDYREVIGTLIHQRRGRVVDAPGDNLLAEFPSALDAVRCAVEIQRVIGERNDGLPGERRMEFRIGIHLGDVAVEGGRIYGDGVNIAARLEGLAEAGGICISDIIQKQVRNKLDLVYDDLGDQPIKNLPEPVRVYRVRQRPERPRAPAVLPGMDELTVPGFSGRSAIAVLPLENLSGDPDQEYFADGIAEDLITRLSSWHVFPVIARNSSFVYKGRAVDVKQVSRELGVRYVVEGSVRKAGNRVRISVQLIDATTGLHIWAERYDRELEDIFVLQDAITEAIVGAMSPELRRTEQERALRQKTWSFTAWDYTQRGFWHFERLSKQDNETARSLFESAAELDPNSALPFYGLAWTHYMDIFSQWTGSSERSIAKLDRTARRSAALDERDPNAQLAMGLAFRIAGQREQAMAAFERTIQLNPSSSYAYFALGAYLAQAGRPDDAIAHLEKAVRLSPNDPMMGSYLGAIATTHFVAGRYEEAVAWARRSLQRSPDFLHARSLLAAGCAQRGRMDEARSAVQAVLRLDPGYSLSTVRSAYPSGDPDFLERYLDGLRRAGLKE
ncbi:MAG: adenylate/guanylate cyclase domain-containing protein [Myxococcales bacterium]|nr:adenylate/guanylate cyclase domain-containing protein [Myxococcales bacterium]